MADNERIEELRRRVQKDPASIAFAQLAEELRRSARFLEAVEVCHAGLDKYPGYLSVRVTLGRCLLDLDRLDDAERELEQVRESAPENLAALRALSQIHQRRGALAGTHPGHAGVQSAGQVGSRPDTMPATRPEIQPKPDLTAPSVLDAAQCVADAEQRVTDAAQRIEEDVSPRTEVPITRKARTVDEDEYMHIVRTLAALDAWLAAIHVARASRGA
jgi:tetratricopeptide (TPR) repeat protein